MQKIVFLDTMIYLHFRPLDQIDWLSILKVDEVRLLAPKITTSELDKHKDSHKNSKVKDRARRVLHMLETAGNQPHQLRLGVTLERYTKRPALNWSDYDLDPARNDDQLIASALTFKQDNPTLAVIIISADATPRMTAKDVGLDAMTLGDEYKLQHDADPAEVENKRLREQLRRLENSQPILSLGFVGADPENMIKVRPAPVLDVAEFVQQETAKLQAKYPILSWGGTSSVDGIGAIQSSHSQKEYGRYHAERDEYFKALPDYLESLWRFEARRSLTFQVELQLVNSGTSIATDVDIFTRFPERMLVLEARLDNRNSKMPNPPKAPTRPRNAADQLLESIAHWNVRPHVPDYSLMQLSVPRPPPNVTGPWVEEQNGSIVSWHTKRVKHNQAEPLYPLAVTFESVDAVRSFRIQYTLQTGNLPDETRGLLHVVIER